MELYPPHSHYTLVWVPNAAEATPISASWSLNLQDTENQSVTPSFEVTNNDSQITVGIAVKSHSITNNMSQPNKITIKRPSDKVPGTLDTYRSRNKPLEIIQKVLVAPIMAILNGLIAKTSQLQKPSPVTLAKRIHNATQSPASQIIQICQNTGWADAKREKAIYDTCKRFDVWPRRVPPAPSRKISATHVNRYFNDKIPTDILFVIIRNTFYTVILFCDTGTAYS